MMGGEGWHKPEVNRHSVWKAYVDQFENGHAAGLLQELTQNSLDAFSPGTAIKDMRIQIKYDADQRILTWRDYDTRGMPHCGECKWGERPDGKPCVNARCAWGAFHNMGYSVKDGALALGSRGMGKALVLLSGERTVVRTTVPGGEHMASEWDKKEDWFWRNAPDLAKAFSGPGTEIEASGVIDAIHTSLLDFEGVVRELQERWFRPLDEGAHITYLLAKGGTIQRREVSPPKWPALDPSQGDAKAQMTIPKVVIKFDGADLGHLREVNFRMAKDAFKEDDPRWGIAIVKNDRQTITRFRDFPPEVPEEIRRRIFGWCNAVCTDQEPFLKAAENATHTGYVVSDTVNVYKAVKRELRKIAKTFAQPFVGAGGERVTEKEAEEGKELLAMLNEALAAVPDFNLFGPGPEKPPRPPEPPKEFIYLSRVEFQNRKYNRGETVEVTAVIKNPTKAEVFVRTAFEQYDPTPVVVDDFNDGVIMRPGAVGDPSTKDVVWKLWIDPGLAPGIHWVQVSISDVHDAPLLDKEGQPIRMRHALYVEVDPPTIHRTGRDGPGLEKGFAHYQWFKKPELSETFEAYVDMSQQAAFVNRRGRRLEYAVQNAKSKRAYAPMVAELVGEKIAEILLEREMSAKDAWTADEVRKVVAVIEASRARFVREMIKVVGRHEHREPRGAGTVVAVGATGDAA